MAGTESTSPAPDRNPHVVAYSLIGTGVVIFLASNFLFTHYQSSHDTVSFDAAFITLAADALGVVLAAVGALILLSFVRRKKEL